MNERRHFPRYTCDMELQINSPQGQTYTVQSNDISEAGISLRVPQSVKTGLAYEGTSLDIGNSFTLLLPDNRAPSGDKLEVECRVMHVRRLSQDFYLIGAWFNSPEASVLSERCSMLANARNNAED